MDNYTTYPSNFMVVDPNGIYSKHYYMGTQRIASRIGDGNATIYEDKSEKMPGLKSLQQNDMLFYFSKKGFQSIQFEKYEDPGLNDSIKPDNDDDYIKPPSIAIYYYHPDHLGTNTIVTNMNGNIYQYFLNLSFGETMAEQTSSGYFQSPWKFNGKELDAETGLYYYGARYYYPRLSNWLSIDPMAEKYFSISSYAYCLNNPVYFIDPDGRKVKPGGDSELTMIQNTLPKEARDYVRLDNNGFIDRTLLNSYSGESLNFNNLKTMVNSDRVVEVLLDDKFTFMGQDGQLGTETMSYVPFDPRCDSESDKDLTGETMGGLSTGESGVMGKTLFPDKDGVHNSPNGNIIVVVNKNLSTAGAAENYSHEANGHALLYILNGGDHKEASHKPVDGLWIEGNKTLMEMIINSKKETIKNMQEQ